MNEAADLLERVRVLYSECEGYSDTGLMEARSVLGNGRGTFTTKFSRPDNLEFSFDGESGAGVEIRCRLRSQSNKTTLSCFGEDDEPESLGLGVAGASGATNGAAHVVPTLLLPVVVGGWPVVDLVRPHLLGRSTINDVDCLLVEGGHPHADPALTVTLSVGIQSLLLHRVEESYVMDGVEENVRLTYSPALRV